MAAAYTFAQALQAAGQNPTRASIVAAINNSHFLGPGLVPFGYSATSHSGYIGTQIGVIKGLAIKLIGTPLTTDDGNGPITPYTTPQVDGSRQRDPAEVSRSAGSEVDRPASGGRSRSGPAAASRLPADEGD